MHTPWNGWLDLFFLTRARRALHADLADAADIHGFLKNSARIRLIRDIRVLFL
jgi:hypothetical protein